MSSNSLQATVEHLMSIVVLVNEKFRQGVPPWEVFNKILNQFILKKNPVTCKFAGYKASLCLAAFKKSLDFQTCIQVGYHRKTNSFPQLFHEAVHDKHCLGVSIGLKLSVCRKNMYLIFLKIIGPLSTVYSSVLSGLKT